MKAVRLYDKKTDCMMWTYQNYITWNNEVAWYKRCETIWYDKKHQDHIIQIVVWLLDIKSVSQTNMKVRNMKTAKLHTKQ